MKRGLDRSFLKRFCAFVLVSTLLLNTVLVPKKAKAFVEILSVPGAAALLYTIAVSCGLIYYSQNGIDQSVSDIYNHMTTDDQQALLESVGLNGYDLKARWVDGRTAAVVTIRNALWEAVRAVIDALYNPGENEITEEGQYDALISGTVTLLASGINNLPLSFKYGSGLSEEFYVEGNGIRHVALYNGNPNTNVYYSNCISSSWSFDSVHQKYVFYVLYNGGTNDQVLDFYLSSGITNAFFYNDVTVGTVNGSESVDNPERTFIHEQTEAQTYVLPVEYDENGDVVYDGGEAVVDYEGTKDLYLGWDVDQLQGVDITGVDLTDAAEQADAAEAADVDVPDVSDVTLPYVGALGLDDLGDVFISKFPFSIPWDFVNAVKLLSASPEAPYIEIDIGSVFNSQVAEVGGWRDDTKIIIDMNSDMFGVLGALCRWFIMIEFGWCLALGTKRLIWTA